MLSSTQCIIAICSSFLITYFISIFFTKHSIRVLPQLGFVDNPQRDKRRVHSFPIATSGGIAMFLAFLLGILLEFRVFAQEETTPVLLLPVFIVVLIGMIDDRLELSSKLKLILQILIGSLCFYLNIRIESFLGFSIPFYLSFIITIIWILACVNAFNLIDGIDGLAAGLGTISSLCLGLFLFAINMRQEALIIFLLGASCLGFLRYNFKDAKIFMGEAGSSFIGLTFAIVSILSSGKLSTIPFLMVPLLAMGLPFFDTFLAIIRRFLKKLKSDESTAECNQVFEGDKEHIHHRLFYMYNNQSKATLTLYLASLIICLISLCLVFLQDSTKFALLFILCLVVYALVKSLTFIEGRILLNYILSLTRKVFFLRLFICIDLLSDFIFVAFAVYASNVIFDMTINLPAEESLLSVIYFGLIFLGFSKLRRIYWPKATISSYFYLIKAIVSLSIIVIISDYYLFDKYMNLDSIHQVKYFIGEHILIFSLMMVLIFTKKLLIKWVSDIGIRKPSLVKQESFKYSKAVIYGTDVIAHFLRYNHLRGNIKKYDIVGILTENVALKNKILHEYKAIGILSDLDLIVKSHNIKFVILASNSRNNEDIIDLISYCKKAKLELIRIDLTQIALA